MMGVVMGQGMVIKLFLSGEWRPLLGIAISCKYRQRGTGHEWESGTSGK